MFVTSDQKNELDVAGQRSSSIRMRGLYTYEPYRNVALVYREEWLSFLAAAYHTWEHTRDYALPHPSRVSCLLTFGRTAPRRL